MTAEGFSVTKTGNAHINNDVGCSRNIYTFLYLIG